MARKNKSDDPDPKWGKLLRTIQKPCAIMWADEDDPDDFGAVIIALKQVRIYEAQGVRTYTVRKVDCSSLKATKERVFKTEKILGVLSAVGDKTQNKVQDTNAIPNTPG